MASAEDVNVRISFLPIAGLPPYGRVVIRIPGVQGITVPGDHVSFSSPARGASGYIHSNYSHSEESTFLVLTLNSGTFPPAAAVSFSFGKVRNPSSAQPSISNVEFLVYDRFDVLRGRALNGFFPSISSGAVVLGAPVISLSDNQMAAKDVRMNVNVSLHSVEPGALLITFVGVSLSCNPQLGCTFSGSSVAINAVVSVSSNNTHDSVMSIEFAGPPSVATVLEPTTNFSFFVDGISIPDVVQASKSDVRGAFVDGLGQLRGLMSSGTFPAIVSQSNVFFIELLKPQPIYALFFPPLSLHCRFAPVDSFIGQRLQCPQRFALSAPRACIALSVLCSKIDSQSLAL
jgi:hypothetical protein